LDLEAAGLLTSVQIVDGVSDDGGYHFLWDSFGWGGLLW
jgi:hypothetical protein